MISFNNLKGQENKVVAFQGWSHWVTLRSHSDSKWGSRGPGAVLTCPPPPPRAPPAPLTHPAPSLSILRLISASSPKQVSDFPLSSISRVSVDPVRWSDKCSKDFPWPVTMVALHFSHALVVGIVTFLINIRTLVVSPVSLEPEVPGLHLTQFPYPSSG